MNKIIKDEFCSSQFKFHLDNRFIYDKLLGSGSFSNVYRVYDTHNKKYYAQKIIDIHKTPDYRNEVNILINLKKKESNNITKIFESFLYGNKFYILFKLYDITLKEYIKKNKSSVTKTFKLVSDITNALYHLHTNKIVHCDIKPDNIVFKNSLHDSIVLIDFGISVKLDNTHANVNSYIQTLYYRAPEIILESIFDYTIDIWSLGCISYEIYYQTLLFDSKTKDHLFIQQNCILDPPSYEFIKKHPPIQTYYDNPKDPSYMLYNNNMYTFKKYEFLRNHQERKITDFVLDCCKWEPTERITYKDIFNYIHSCNKS
jgi:dual specificity tyrosine-phosphorylation-regulated kinase 2/3/4